MQRKKWVHSRADLVFVYELQNGSGVDPLSTVYKQVAPHSSGLGVYTSDKTVQAWKPFSTVCHKWFHARAVLVFMRIPTPLERGTPFSQCANSGSQTRGPRGRKNPIGKGCFSSLGPAKGHFCKNLANRTDSARESVVFFPWAREAID